MLKIRLSRMGKKGKPSYRIVISEHTKDTAADYMELLGHYDPLKTPKVFDAQKERIEYWLSKGAQCSPTVHNLLVSHGIIKDKKVKASKHAKRAKEEERQEGAAEAKPAEAKVEEKVEAPKEEVKIEEVKPVEVRAEEKKEEIVKEEVREEVKTEEKVEEKKEEGK